MDEVIVKIKTFMYLKYRDKISEAIMIELQGKFHTQLSLAISTLLIFVESIKKSFINCRQLLIFYQISLYHYFCFCVPISWLVILLYKGIAVTFLRGLPWINGVISQVHRVESTSKFTSFKRYQSMTHWCDYMKVQNPCLELRNFLRYNLSSRVLPEESNWKVV